MQDLLKMSYAVASGGFSVQCGASMSVVEKIGHVVMRCHLNFEPAMRTRQPLIKRLSSNGEPQDVLIRKSGRAQASVWCPVRHWHSFEGVTTNHRVTHNTTRIIDCKQSYHILYDTYYQKASQDVRAHPW